MTKIHQIPLNQIDRGALPRDRTATDEEAARELFHSIARDGLRQPIELWELRTPRPPFVYGLISGHRRLAAVAEHAEIPGQPQTIPALFVGLFAVLDRSHAM